MCNLKEILEKLKDLFKGEDVVKRHCMLLLLLLLPSFMGSLRYIIDKDTPKDILMPALCVFAVLLLLCIVPLITFSGFAADFYNRKIKNKSGLPELNFGTLVNGIKLLPLQIVWGIYGLILFGVIFLTPLFAGIFTLFKSSNPEPFAIVGFIIGIIFLYFLTLIIFVLLAPFYGYAYFTFIEDYVYRAEYFNPFLFVKYMKMVFKETMLVFLKFFVVGLVVSTVVSIISGVVGMFGGVFAVSLGMIAEPNAQNPMFTPVAMAIIIPIATILTMISTYSGTLVGFAAGHSYVDIYKKEIRLPDPLENTEKEQENQEETPNQEPPRNNDDWVE